MMLSQLLGLRVRDADGRRLGRVTEVRAKRDDDGTPRVVELLLGRDGLRHRLTGRSRRPTHALDFDPARKPVGRTLRADAAELRDLG